MSISEICAKFIYDTCDDESCHRHHINEINLLRKYLKQPNFKKVECVKGAHCKYYLCQFSHEFDDVILSSNSTASQVEDARNSWRIAKHTAFCEEFLKGDRTPKNQKEEQLLEKLKKDSKIPNSVEEFVLNPSEFPTITNEISIEQVNEGFEVVKKFFEMNPEWLQNPIIYNMFCISTCQNQMLNK
jgi:hypothetical protein